MHALQIKYLYVARNVYRYSMCTITQQSVFLIYWWAFGIQSKDSMLYCIAIYKSYMYLSKSCRLNVCSYMCMYIVNLVLVFSLHACSYMYQTSVAWENNFDTFRECILKELYSEQIWLSGRITSFFKYNIIVLFLWI